MSAKSIGNILKDKDETGDLNVRGNMWMHFVFLPRSHGELSHPFFIYIYAFFILHDRCANVDFSIWYGVFFFLIQKWKSICATYNICSKVILTQIFEGPCSTNNIDFYSNYEGDIIVSLSFLVLTCKAILWQNSNLSHRKDFQCESPALFESFLLSICKQLLRFYSWAESQSHCSSVWDFQVKELPFLKQHCTKFQD